MKSFTAHIVRKWAFYSVTIFSTVVLVSYQNCGKVKFSASRDQTLTPQSCGSISMAPPNGLSENTSVAFTVTPPNGITISDLSWSFTKGSSSTVVYSTTTNPAVHTFNHASEGVGDYLATAIFMKSDGNGCELAQSFQIITGDLCVDPSGISGPTVGFVGELTSPFSVDYEDCFVGTAVWDMDNDGIPEHTVSVTDSVTHTYTAPGTYTVTVTVIDGEDNSQTVLTSTIVVNYPNCPNGATNPPDCNQCPVGQTPVGGQCVPSCTNGAINPPLCTNCPAGQTPVGGQCVPNCPNGANNPPTCTTCPVGQTPIGGQCVPNCPNGATNPPSCTRCDAGQILVNNQCINDCPNGAIDPPACITCLPGQFIIGGRCTTPVNCMVGTTQVLHGATRTFYDNSNVGCGAGQSPSCASQARTCDNGVMSGSQNFAAIACQSISCPTTCQNGAINFPACTTCPAGRVIVDGQCVIPSGCNVNGTPMVHGETRSFYPSSAVSCGGSCTPESRTCNNGVVSGNTANTATTCSVAACTSCTLDGITVAHGQSRDFFIESAVTCSGSCSSISRTCNNGSFTGDPAYNRATCVEAICNHNWQIGEWSACSVTACGQTGTQTRSVICMRSDGVVADDSACGTKPANVQACSTAPCNQAGCWTCVGTDSECYPGPAAGCGYGGYLSAHGGPDLRKTSCAQIGDRAGFQRSRPSGVICDGGWLSCEPCKPNGIGGN
ncbi:MAG: thrombospondin type-1 domain-containing protein [Bdellovibrionota bacterium]